MGDTYYIKKINCAYCGAENNFEEDEMESDFPGIGFAYTFEFGGDFICTKCHKKNEIKMDLVAVKPEKKKRNKKSPR